MVQNPNTTPPPNNYIFSQLPRYAKIYFSHTLFGFIFAFSAFVLIFLLRFFPFIFLFIHSYFSLLLSLFAFSPPKWCWLTFSSWGEDFKHLHSCQKVRNISFESLGLDQNLPEHGTSDQCFGSGSAFDLCPGSVSTFRMRIQIQQLITLAPKAKKFISFRVIWLIKFFFLSYLFKF